MDSNQALKWRFDVSTFRLIGRDLITDRVTALFELIKNSYDANANVVNVYFEEVSTGKDSGVIRIEDDGYGMSFEDIRDKWMVIGTSNKRVYPYSPAPYNRKCVGEKGIGRFAVDKLGDHVSIVTKKRGERRWLKVDIDWASYYRDAINKGDIRLFTDVENVYSYIDAENIEESGTKLIISSLREPWVEKEIRHLTREVSKIVSPFANLSYPFKVHIQALEFGFDEDAVKTLDDFSIATTSFSIDAEDGQQQIIFYDEESNTFRKSLIPLKSFGGVRIVVHYFNDPARRQYKKSFPNSKIDGFKVYRDGIIATPFAETNEESDKKRDVLGIDKRLWQNIFDRVSTREFLGIIEISAEGNPKIIDATNRQDFVDNDEYREFKDFIITQLYAIEAYKKAERQAKRRKANDGLQTASEDIKLLESSVRDIVSRNPELSQVVTPLLKQIKATDKTVSSAIREHNKALEELTRKENIYLSIMSLQQFSITMTHAVRTMLNQIRDRVEFFYKYYPDPDEEMYFRLYAKEMYERFKTLNRTIDYLLSYSQSNIEHEDINLKEVFEEIMGYYDSTFLREGISLQTDFPSGLVLGNSNRQFYRDILQNILDNSIKAMVSSAQKVIRCSYEVKDDMLEILVSDTGKGIPVERREQVFEIFYTTTEDQGGGGVGLYIVKTRVESLRGTVSIIDSEFGEIGTTIRVIIPFKK